MALKHGKGEGADVSMADGAGVALKQSRNKAENGADVLATMSTCMLTQGAPADRIDTDTHLRYTGSVRFGSVRFCLAMIYLIVYLTSSKSQIHPDIDTRT